MKRKKVSAEDVLRAKMQILSIERVGVKQDGEKLLSDSITHEEVPSAMSSSSTNVVSKASSLPMQEPVTVPFLDRNVLEKLSKTLPRSRS